MGKNKTEKSTMQFELLSTYYSKSPCKMSYTPKNFYGNDVGYHYLIDKNGVVHNGRSVNLEGCHSGKYNRDSISVCFESNERMIKKHISKETVMLLFLLSFVYKAPIRFYDVLIGLSGSYLSFFRSELIRKIQERQGWYMELPAGEDEVEEWFKKLCDKYNIPYNCKGKLIFCDITILS